MGLTRSRSQIGQEKKSKRAVRKDSAMAERNVNSTTTPDALRQKSASSQERPRTAHSGADRPKTADRHGQERPKTSDRQQAVDRRRSFSRPRTATSAHSAAKPKEREQEKDKSELAIPTQTIEYKTGKDTYNFPTPSPRLPPPRSAASHAPSPARSPMPTTADDSPRIGVAIGSPRENAPHWGRTHTVDQVAMQPASRAPLTRAKTELPQHPEQTAEPPSKKKGSWKKLGGIFGRKPSTRAAVPEPFYQLRPTPEHEEQPQVAPTRTLHSAARQQTQPTWAQTPPADATSPLPPSSAERNRARSMTRGMARMEARMQADRATFEEGEDRQKQHQGRMIRTPSVILKEGSQPAFGSPAAARSSEEIFKTIDATGKRNDSPLGNVDGSGPLRLDLDIPDHHMERYSVMFENFLGSSGERRPSIIERRQSKLQKKRSLKRLDEANRKEQMEMPKVPQRSATSPHLSQMPGSLSIKTGKKVRSPKASPAAPEAEAPVTAVHRAQVVKRSNTAPIQSSSPVRRNFSKPRMVMVAEPSAVDRAPQLPTPRGMSMYSENSLPPTPTSGFESGEESPVRAPPLPTAPKKPQHRADHSGTWDMLTANPNTTAIPKRTASLARQEPDPYRRVKSPEDLEGKVVQVSVARQVSVSKARKQVRQAMDSKQPLRPRVVELGKNRKSTMVLIEGGEE